MQLIGQKKIFNHLSFNIMLLLTVMANLSGCFTKGIQGNSLEEAESTYNLMKEKMDDSDKVRISQLVQLSSAEHTETWVSTKGYEFEFSSIRIFVNSSHQPCREYYLKTKIRQRDRAVQPIVCRMGGEWRLSQLNRTNYTPKTFK